MREESIDAVSQLRPYDVVLTSLLCAIDFPGHTDLILWDPDHEFVKVSGFEQLLVKS